MNLPIISHTVFCPTSEAAKAISEQLTQRHFVHHTTITFLEPIDYQALHLAAELAQVQFSLPDDRSLLSKVTQLSQIYFSLTTFKP